MVTQRIHNIYLSDARCMDGFGGMRPTNIKSSSQFNKSKHISRDRKRKNGTKKSVGNGFLGKRLGGMQRKTKSTIATIETNGKKMKKKGIP